MKTRADGEGSIYEADGYFIAAVSYRDPATGKRRQRRVKCRTKREAKTALGELRKRVEAGQPLRDSTVTLTAWSQKWERTVLAASQRRATTQGTYSTLLKTCVRPYLGGLPLAEVRASDIEAWLLELDRKGLSASTRRQALTVLRSCLDAAVRDGLLASNPTTVVTRPVVRREEAHHYTPEQVAALLKQAEGHRLRPMLLVLLGTGLRRGEALALQWENVDLTRGELRVRGTLVRTGAGLVIHPPKTRNGWRTVPLSPPVLAALAEQRQSQRLDRLKAGPSWISSEHVFTTEAGTPLDPRNTGRWFTKLAARTSVEDEDGEQAEGEQEDAEDAKGIGGSLHSLRHTALTSMATSGVPLSVVSRVAGHESITTTIDLYGHLTEQAARDAVAAAAGSLGLA